MKVDPDDAAEMAAWRRWLRAQADDEADPPEQAAIKERSAVDVAEIGFCRRRGRTWTRILLAGPATRCPGSIRGSIGDLISWNPALGS